MNDTLDLNAARVPRDEEGPVFDAPWQANVFALTVHLHTRGAFGWPQWVKTISAQIKAAPARPGERVNDAYYRQWAAAFETLVGELGITNTAAIAQRAERWRQAYLHTPHGAAVALANADCPATAQHPHHQGPIAVSPAIQL